MKHPSNDNGPQRRTPDGRLHFHYRREERLAGRPERAPRGGFLSRNRPLAIVLIDLFVVFVVFILVWVFLLRDQPDGELGPFALDLEAFIFDQELYATVTVTATERVMPNPDAQPLARVTFPDETVFTDLLPDEADEQVQIRHVMSLSEALFGEDAQSVTVVVEAGQDSVELTTTVE